MKKMYIAGVVVGLIIVLFSVPLGEQYGAIFLRLCEGMETERFLLLSEQAISSFQIIGGIVSLLAGIGCLFKNE
ncbi:MAG: hypothetical protein NC092_08725 [Butyrivibrio sp.]|nr:hypothetical protein [Muribaculum sp.]MCM1552759.1 hypothetical protein [Butyrivibrio sp.]